VGTVSGRPQAGVGGVRVDGADLDIGVGLVTVQTGPIEGVAGRVGVAMSGALLSVGFVVALTAAFKTTATNVGSQRAFLGPASRALTCGLDNEWGRRRRDSSAEDLVEGAISSFPHARGVVVLVDSADRDFGVVLVSILAGPVETIAAVVCSTVVGALLDGVLLVALSAAFESAASDIGTSLALLLPARGAFASRFNNQGGLEEVEL